jgi:transcriptional regulator NrdR family protein
MSACPVCACADTIVTETRLLVNGWTRRRRRCKLETTHRWTTYELTAAELDLSSYDPYELKERRYANAHDQVERDAVRSDDSDAA